MTCRMLTGLFFFFLASFCLAKSPINPAFKSSSKAAFIENKGQIIDQHSNPNPVVLYLLNTPGFNVQLRKNGFSYDIYSIRQQLEGNRQQAIGNRQEASNN